MEANDRLIAKMRRMGMAPEKWITLQEAARKLGAPINTSRYRLDYLEGTKVNGRWLVLTSKVETLRQIRSGEYVAPEPPRKTCAAPEPAWTPPLSDAADS